MINLEEIAKKSKVSLSTVSRVLNQPDIVKLETRQRVISAIEELGYYNSRKKVIRKNSIIGLAVTDMKLDFIGELIRSLERELTDTSYNLLLFNMKGEKDVSKFLINNIIFRNKIEALIIFEATLDAESRKYFRSIDIPVVLMQSHCDKEKSISTNNYIGAGKAVQFLIDRGYQKIAFIGWKPDDKHIIDRFHGSKNALENVHQSLNIEKISYNTLSIEGGYNATTELLSKYKPDAIFYACDTMAFGGYKFLYEKKISIPEEIGIIGFDDLEFASVIGLTTMNQFIDAKARIVISYLLDRLSGKIKTPQEDEICVTPQLVIRNSTK